MSSGRTFAWQRFARASTVLERRWRGLPAAGDDWLCREAVRALSLPLDTRAQTSLRVVLKDGISARELPTTLGGLPLKLLRAPALRAQSGPPLLTLGRTLEDGTTTAMVRDRLNSERCYLLTCGHVVAPDSAARYNDDVRISRLPGGVVLKGFLREWQPAVGPGSMPSTMDAALVEVDPGTLQVLRQLAPDWLPRSVGDTVNPGLPVALQRVDGPLDGVLCEHWSGEVGVGGEEYPDYFLQDAIGYATGSLTQGGDSGGAIWGEGDVLLGMHIGAIESGHAPAATAVMARVKPVLDWYCVKPFTRLDPATLTPADWPTLPPTGRAPAALETQAAADAGDQVVLAKTLWGEARGEGREGMEAVAAVVLNRRRTAYRDRTTASEVCLDPKQFSCWNADDPNSRKLTRIDKQPDDDFNVAMVVAAKALRGYLVDPTQGARHYVATTLPLSRRPRWLDEKRPCVVIGRHEFYNNIR